jgi:hypothetical protein
VFKAAVEVLRLLSRCDVAIEVLRLLLMMMIMIMIFIFVFFWTSRRVLRRAKLGNYKQSAILIRSQNHKGKKTPLIDSPRSLIPRCCSASVDPRKHFKPKQIRAS